MTDCYQLYFQRLNRRLFKPQLSQQQMVEAKKLARLVRTQTHNRQPDGLTPYQSVQVTELEHRRKLYRLTFDPVWVAGINMNRKVPEPFGLPTLPRELK